MKKTIRNIKQNFLLVIIVLLVGVVFGWIIFHPSDRKITQAYAIEGHEGHDHSSEDPTTWTCSMHPQIKQNKPGQCPICAMDLIPLKSIQIEGENIDQNQIVMTESAIKLADIQTMTVTKAAAVKSIHLQGKVNADERNILELTSRFGGRIENLHVNFTGQRVMKGDKIATVYSPDLLSAQRELLEASSLKESRPSLYKSARLKLKLWDLSENQINSIEESGEPKVYFEILSPISGTVTMRHVSIGDYISEGTPLFKVVDLSSVWVMFDAYESDLPWIKPGDHVDIDIKSLSERSLEGKVTFIDPIIDSKTRVAKIRIELQNDDYRLKPEMFAKGVLHSQIAEDNTYLVIPKSSVLWTGKRAVVYVKVPDREYPTFLHRIITLGPEAGESYIVKEGLLEGEIIAVNGVFKIDAAAQLEGKPSMMNPEGGIMSTGHNHGDAGAIETDMDSELQSITVPEEFLEQLTSVYITYLTMKDAFIESKASKVSATASNVVNSLESVDMGLLEGSSHIKWMELSDLLEKALKSIYSEPEIEAQRAVFSDFNLVFYKTLIMFGLSETTTYYQFCPMALDNSGAFWFSSTEEILNPYFGDEMLNCGETKEIIENISNR